MDLPQRLFPPFASTLQKLSCMLNAMLGLLFYPSDIFSRINTITPCILGDEDSVPPRGVSWKPLRRAKTESLQRRSPTAARRYQYFELCGPSFDEKFSLPPHPTISPSTFDLLSRTPGSFKYIPTTGGMARRWIRRGKRRVIVIL